MFCRLMMVLALLSLSVACQPPAGTNVETPNHDNEDGDDPVVELPSTCTEGDMLCAGGVPRQCSESGDSWIDLSPCGDDTSVCVDGLGCLACRPNQRDCDGGRPRECAADGSGYVIGEACAQGQSCQYGVCVDPCAEAAASNSYVGCEYIAVDLPNAAQQRGLSPRDSQFAVVVSNGSDEPVIVRAYLGDDESSPVLTTTVPPNNLSVLELNQAVPPARTNIEGTGVHEGRAFHIVSERPITAYQFNPLNNTEEAYSNDASLLLPVTSLDRDYIVSTGDGLVGQDSSEDGVLYNWGAFVTIIALEEDTIVTVEPSTEVAGGAGIPQGLATIERTLGRFDVLNVESLPLPYEGAQRGDANLSGSRIRSSAPVAVFAGNVCTVMPYGQSASCCCDHIEEQMIPLSAWGQSFVIGRGLARRISTDPELEYFRITGGNVPGGQDAILLTYHPFTPEGAPTRLDEGQSVEFSSLADFTIEANGPIMVTSFFVSSFVTSPEIDAGSGAGVRMCFSDAECAGLNYAAVCVDATLFGGSCMPIGDPSMTVLPPVEQFRNSYVFLVPNDYAHDAVTIMAPMDAEVLLDGERLTGFELVGEINGVPFGVIRQEIADGTHHLTTSDSSEVGLLVYGMDKDVSYGYPGGLDLEVINPLE